MEGKYYAHTDPESNDRARWEPLFTPDCKALKGQHCEECERLDRFHGHLNKVAWWTAKFAAAMFPPGMVPKPAPQRGRSRFCLASSSVFQSVRQSRNVKQTAPCPQLADSNRFDRNKIDSSTRTCRRRPA
jgi:hypothetical protein